MAEFTPEVTQWLQLTRDLIAAAGDYAGAVQDDPAMTAMMRAIQVNCAALNAAMTAVQMSRIPVAAPIPFNGSAVQHPTGRVDNPTETKQ